MVMKKNMKLFSPIQYEYGNLKIGGGGFVTGITFHPTDSRTLYIRTDIGGIYRYDFDKNTWVYLASKVTAQDPAQTYPLALALDENDPDKLFFTCGDKHSNYLCISSDKGENIKQKPIPCSVHGNEVGRATGDRLLFKNGRLYFGSQTAGIIYSDDMGESWQSADLFGEKNISLIWSDSEGKLFIAGCSGGENSPDGVTRGHTLYYSTDGLKSFLPLTAPEPVRYEKATYYGFVPQRITGDSKYLYITFASSGEVFYGGMGAYACDTGSLSGGKVYRYRIENGVPVFNKDITPADETPCGYSGISSSDEMILLSTVCRKKGGDIIYKSTDNGESWQIIMNGLDYSRFDWNIPYMKPRYNGGGNCVHWISDIKLSPFDCDKALFNTGTGLFMITGLTNGDVLIKPFCGGIEETVHLNVYTTPHGTNRVIDIIGDLGGFAFKDYDSECENSFANEKGDRYITCLNADFTLQRPEYIAATPRGNWTGRTKGGLILSKDCGTTWKRLSMPRGISKLIDDKLNNIEKPNVDSGWTAISADGKRILWAVAGGRGFSNKAVCYTDNEGESWQQSVFMDCKGNTAEEHNVKIFSDYYDSELFFAIAEIENLGLYISRDKSKTFKEVSIKTDIKCPRYAHYRLARQPDKSGVFWLANGINGLYRFEINDGSVQIENILPDDRIDCIGFGKGKDKLPAMYVTGNICGEYGFFISDDMGKSFARINNDCQQFGVINSICGDMREYGVFCLATGSHGLMFGRQKSLAMP